MYKIKLLREVARKALKETFTEMPYRYAGSNSFFLDNLRVGMVIYPTTELLPFFSPEITGGQELAVSSAIVKEAYSKGIVISRIEPTEFSTEGIFSNYEKVCDCIYFGIKDDNGILTEIGSIDSRYNLEEMFYAYSVERASEER